MTNHPQQFVNYHFWATQTLLEHIKTLPSGVLTQEVNTSFPTIAHAFSHIYAVDQVWNSVVNGRGMKEALEECMPRVHETVLYTADEFAEAFARLAENYQEWFRSGPDLTRTILLENPYIGPRNTTLEEIVHHAVNHGTYHRGNISAMLRQLGHASTMNDYILYWYQEQATSNTYID
ncbi:DinB family protein [Paenibacillus sp. MMS20-IR301]|uniref:DinB family protein n=1 Tax=Paenibacillus sp. MMS20-IR301 TaxID=2895946 RepID=UPI0028EA925A|nr:DinB family protein [Paenibacillus sp. MMS20-IR301]WNS45283.1 DinB family protein [Paenibacillus sp. MMS20-IR301]